MDNEKIEKEIFAKNLTKIFPYKKSSLDAHILDYQEILGHIFFSEEINISLFDLLKINEEKELISTYCTFIEDMWKRGTDEVINIVDVTILERLSDDELVWNNLKNYLSLAFITYINEEVLTKNIAMFGVKRL